jgi:beta-xylosidase/ribosomal protein L24E
VAVSTLVASAVTTASPASAATVLPGVGVQFHATWADYTDAQRAAVLDKMAAAKVQWVRVDMGWSAMEERGRGVIAQYHVDVASRTIDMARARGIKVLGMLWATPAWANGGQAVGVPPTDVNEYARFAGWLAAQFKGRVAAWEIWNEPNLSHFWSTKDPVKYAAMVRASYPAIKASDPATQVVIGAVSNSDTPWLARMYDAGVRGFYDVLSVHPYQGISNLAPEVPDDGQIWTMDHVRTVRALMVQRGDGDKPIWGTEFGWSAHPNTGTEGTWQRGVTEAQQADYLARSLTWFAANHPYVTNVFWYNERQKATGDPHEDNYGLLTRDLNDRPVYTKLKEVLTAAAATTVAPAPTTTTTVAPAPTTTTTVAPAPAPTTTTTVAPAPTTTTTVAPAPAPTTTTTVAPAPAPAPAPSVQTSATAPALAPHPGYRIVGSDGRTVAYTDNGTSSTGAVPIARNASVVGSATDGSGAGAWIVTDDGSVFPVAGAPFLGGMGGHKLNQAIVGVAATPRGDGYWLVARDGGIFAFGSARFFGSTGGVKLNQPIVGMASSPTGNGYWLVAADGGIFAFGDARFFGSTGGIKLNQPIVAMAAAPNGDGYWLAARDGGIFAFGSARFFGSTGGVRLNQPIVGLTATSTGNGYWFVARDGGIFAFGDAAFRGAGTGLGVAVASMAPAR